MLLQTNADGTTRRPARAGARHDKGSLTSLAATALMALTLLGCDRLSKQRSNSEAGEDEESAEASPKKKKKRKKQETSSSATDDTKGPSAAASAPAQLSPQELLAKKFSGDPPAGGIARPIFAGNRGSGVVLLVPPVFDAGSGVYGDGYVTSVVNKSNPNMHLYDSWISAYASPTKERRGDPESTVGLAYGVKVIKETWDAPVAVGIGPAGHPAKVRRGNGTNIQTKKPWGVWCMSTEIKHLTVSACGSWASDRPELEDAVIAVLKSAREGVGVPTDPGQP